MYQKKKKPGITGAGAGITGQKTTPTAGIPQAKIPTGSSTATGRSTGAIRQSTLPRSSGGLRASAPKTVQGIQGIQSVQSLQGVQTGLLTNVARQTSPVLSHQPTLSEMYAQYKDDPRVDELVAEMEAEEQQAAARNAPLSPEEDAALGRRVYNRIMGIESDEATTAARKAEANAYDLARRGAGGAGTSYAAMAGAKAYADTYADERERIEEEERYEKDRLADAYLMAMDLYNGTNASSLRQWLSTEGFSTQDADMIMETVSSDWDKKQAQTDAEEAETTARAEAESYERKKEEAFATLFELASAGSDEQELTDIARHYYGLGEDDTEIMIETLGGRMNAYKEDMATVEQDAYKAVKGEAFDVLYSMAQSGGSAESMRAAAQWRGLSDEDIDVLLDVLGVAPEGTTGGMDSAIKTAVSEILNGDGIYAGASRSHIISQLEAARMGSEEINAVFQSVAMHIADDMNLAIKSGRMDDTMLGKIQMYNPNLTEKSWNNMSESRKIIEMLDTMSDMVLHDGLPDSYFYESMKEVATESVSGIREAFDDRSWWTKITTADYGEWSDQLLEDVAAVAQDIRNYREIGSITATQYEQILYEMYVIMGGEKIDDDIFREVPILHMSEEEKAVLKDMYEAVQKVKYPSMYKRIPQRANRGT